jgi:hypothetical protein
MTSLPMTEPSPRKMMTGIAEFYCARDYLTPAAFLSYDSARRHFPPRDMMRA